MSVDVFRSDRVGEPYVTSCGYVFPLLPMGRIVRRRDDGTAVMQRERLQDDGWGDLADPVWRLHIAGRKNGRDAA